jgi:hypothetical protein
MLWPRGYLSNKTAFAIIFKLARKVGVASRGQNQLPKVILDVSFTKSHPRCKLYNSIEAVRRMLKPLPPDPSRHQDLRTSR